MKKNSFDPKIRLEVREERLWTAYLIHLSMLDWDSFMCWEQQEVLEICLDLLEMCIFMDSVRRRFFVPCVHWSYLEWHSGASVQDMWSVQPMSSLHWSLFSSSRYFITFTRRERSCIWCLPWWQLQPFFQRLRQWSSDVSLFWWICQRPSLHIIIRWMWNW